MSKLKKHIDLMTLTAAFYYTFISPNPQAEIHASIYSAATFIILALKSPNRVSDEDTD